MTPNERMKTRRGGTDPGLMCRLRTSLLLFAALKRRNKLASYNLQLKQLNCSLQGRRDDDAFKASVRLKKTPGVGIRSPP